MMKRDALICELGITPVWKQRQLTKTVAVPQLAEEPAVNERESPIAELGWEALLQTISTCRACDLCQERHKTVAGVGDPNATWLFIGEGPGAEEDARGEPFVGQAGRLLELMLTAINLVRGKDVYIANVVKCRPPHNRAPSPDEAEACRPYLERQIALIQPQIIVALGKSAAGLLLKTEDTIASLRGRVHRYHDVPLIVTYHPAYLLRQPGDKGKVWSDLLLAKKCAGETRATLE